MPRVLPVLVLTLLLVVSFSTASKFSEPSRENEEEVAEGAFVTDRDGKAGMVDGSRAAGVDWERYAFKANVTGVHFNLNQPAKRVDSSLDNWTQLFHIEGQLRDGDVVYLCAPVSDVTVEVQEWRNATLVARVGFSGVPPCR